MGDEMTLPTWMIFAFSRGSRNINVVDSTVLLRETIKNSTTCTPINTNCENLIVLLVYCFCWCRNERLCDRKSVQTIYNIHVKHSIYLLWNSTVYTKHVQTEVIIDADWAVQSERMPISTLNFKALNPYQSQWATYHANSLLCACVSNVAMMSFKTS